MQAYIDQEASLRRDASLPGEGLQEHCDQLATAPPPGVEELRINHGAVESRQWTLVTDGSIPRWAYVRTKDGPSDGWAPKPRLDSLNFQPPLEPVLANAPDQFLAYAAAENQSPGDSLESTIVGEVFGAPLGVFTWRDRKYTYTLASELPCFHQLQ